MENIGNNSLSMPPMDVSYFNKCVLSADFEDISKDLNKFNECTFYYDETNNIRKLHLRDNDFNAPIEKDFVLGGVMHFGNNITFDLEKFKGKINLQKSVNEIKFKHISKGKHFLEILEDDKVYQFLHWLDDSDLFIHYSNVNNLYFAIVDIVDSIDAFEHCNVERFYLKNEVYNLVRQNYRDFYDLMIQCGYPNILQKYIKLFCDRLLKYAHKAEKTPYLGFLVSGLKQAKEQKEMLFLSGNEEKVVMDIGDYSKLYLQRIATFVKAKHIFDNEENVKKELIKYNLHNDGIPLNNYTFVDSSSNTLIQISDCVVGFLGKFFTYINSIDMQEAQQLRNRLNEKQLKTLNLFSNLIAKSNQLSKALFYSIEPRYRI